MTELLPCPFCGGEAQVMKMDLGDIEEGWQVWGVWCVDDLHAEEHGGYQHVHYIDNYATEAEAISAWNTRYERTCICTTDDSAWCFVCSECGKSFPRNKLYLAHNHGEINYCPNCGRRVVE